jgi:hypothetical protein
MAEPVAQAGHADAVRSDRNSASLSNPATTPRALARIIGKNGFHRILWQLSMIIDASKLWKVQLLEHERAIC